jgi:hypothetical protein
MYRFTSSFYSLIERALPVLKVAVKKANVGGPVIPAVNSIILEIG